MATRLLPLARTTGLAREEVDGELLVYDLDRNKAFCLNESMASVWEHCDGLNSPERIAKRLRCEETLVWHALDQLGRSGLLEKRIESPALMSRRALAKAAAIAVPLITAVLAPTAAMAAGCSQSTNRNNGCACTGNGQCLSGNCCKGTGDLSYLKCVNHCNNGSGCPSQTCS